MSEVIKNVKSCSLKMDFPLVLLIFFLLFSPPIIPKINTAIIAAVVVFFVLIIKHRTEFKETIIDSGILHFVVIMVVFFVYVAIVTIVNFFTGEFVQLMHYITLWYRYFLIVPVLMICCVYICIRCKKRNFNIYDLAMSYVYAGMLQFILVLATLLVPALKAAFIAFIYKNTGDIYLGTPWVMERRGFGFSNSFVDSFGFGMGIVAVLPLFFLKKTKEKIALFVPCLILISLVNVRTGLIMSVIGLLFALPVILKAFKESAVRIIAVALTCVMLLCVFIGTVYIKNPKTLGWIFEDVISFIGVDFPEETTEVELSTTLPVAESTTGATSDTVEENIDDFTETQNLVAVVETTVNTDLTETTETPVTTQVTEATTVYNTENEFGDNTQQPEKPGFLENLTAHSSQNNTAELLFRDDFWNLPIGSALVFGTGHSIYGAEGYPHSDVGYINDLWVGGIVGALILYAAFALLFVKAFKITKEINIRCLVLFFSVAILVFQVKANAIMFNAGINTILPMLFYICFFYKQKSSLGEK